MLKQTKTKAWAMYMALQAIGLIYLFTPLPVWFEHNLIVRRVILAVIPGSVPAIALDFMKRQRFAFAPLDIALITVITLVIDCGLFAVVLLLADMIIKRRNAPADSLH